MQNALSASWWDMIPLEVREKINQRVMNIEAPTPYLSDPEEINHPYVSPLIASNLRNLPAAVVILAEKDDLREAGQKYADKLCNSGVSTYVYCQQGINHLAGDGARASLLARESLNVAVTALQRIFSKDSMDLKQREKITVIENQVLE